MSALWVLALGASIGYLAFKKQKMQDRLELAVKEWEGSGAEQSLPQPPDGASYREIKQAWQYTADTRNRHFNERLPDIERDKLLQAEDAQAKEVHDFNSAFGQAPIEGVYLEQIVPF